MKILHLSSEYPPQNVFGLGRYVEELAAAQAELGHDMEVITNSHGGKESDVIRSGVRIRRVHFPPPPKATVTSAMILHFNLQVVERCVEQRFGGEDCSYDIVNCHDWLTFPAAFHLGRLLKVPIVTTIHDVIFNKVCGRAFAAEDAYVAGVENWACHTSGRVIVLSNTVRAEAVKAYHASPERVCVVPGGVGIKPIDASDMPGIREWRRSKAEDNEALLVYVGRLDPEKGIWSLLNAAKRLKAARPSGWRLAVIGSGSLSERAKKQAVADALQDHVSLVGYVPFDQLRLVYAAADVVVVPSEYEPFGLVALEAQRIGTPVIVADTGGLRETLAQTGGGVSFPPGNDAELAAAMEQTLSSDDLRAELGSRGQVRVEQLFGWSMLAEKITDVYADALREPAPQNVVPPQWEHPHAKEGKGQTSSSPSRPSTEPATHITVFWDTLSMPALRPVLERLSSSHGLAALDARINVVPIVYSDQQARPWERPLQSDRINYVTLPNQPVNCDGLISKASVVVGEASLRQVLIEKRILDPRQTPTVWFGKQKLGFEDECYYADNLDNLRAVTIKALCDERFRKALAPKCQSLTNLWHWEKSKDGDSRILHIVPQLVTGGAETTLLDIVKGARDGFRHEVLSLGPLDGPLPTEFEKAGVPIRKTESCSPHEFQASLEKGKPDLLHLHSMSYVPGWLPIHRHLAMWPIVETEHVVNIGSGHFGPVDRLVCVSTAAQEAHMKYRDLLDLSNTHMEVIYNGIDSALFRDLPSKSDARNLLRLPQDRPIIGRVSALARNKLTKDALEVIPMILARIPDALFVIVGDGPQRKPAEAWVASKGLEDSVRFLGERRDIPTVLRAFDVFGYYTTKEALGNVILEAIAAGVPVVTTDVEGTKEAMGKAPGQLVPLGDHSGFADAVREWVEKVVKEGFRSSHTLPRRFTRTAMVKKYAATYRQLLARHAKQDSVANLLERSSEKRESQSPGSPECLMDDQDLRRVSPAGSEDHVPPVTILLPVYNANRSWLDESLRSIHKQTYPNWSLIIVNDGSTEAFDTWLKERLSGEPLLANRTRILRMKTNSGVGAALNAGLAECETELVARLDADDRMLPDRLAKQVAAFLQSENLSVLGGCASHIDQSGSPTRGRYVYPTDHDGIMNMMASSCAMAHPAVMYRRSAVLGVGGYRPECLHYEDYDLWVRLAETGARFSNVPEDLIEYRVHDDSMSNVHRIAQAKGGRACADRMQRLHNPKTSRHARNSQRMVRIAAHCPWRHRESHRFRDLNIRIDFHPDKPLDYDFVVDLDAPFSEFAVSLPPERRIYATTEPSKFSRYTDALIGRLEAHYRKLILSWHEPLSRLPHCHPWHALEKLVQPAPPGEEKIFGLSGIISEKSGTGMDGYALRRQILERQNDFTIPSTVYNHTRSWRGQPLRYPLASKMPAMKHMFHLSIENCSEPGYFTEKLIDAFACRCVPLYYGDPAIGEIFDLRGMILLDPANFVEQINALSEDDYRSRVQFVNENFMRSKEYWSMEKTLSKRLAALL